MTLLMHLIMTTNSTILIVRLETPLQPTFSISGTMWKTLDGPPLLQEHVPLAAGGALGGTAAVRRLPDHRVFGAVELFDAEPAGHPRGHGGHHGGGHGCAGMGDLVQRNVIRPKA